MGLGEEDDLGPVGVRNDVDARARMFCQTQGRQEEQLAEISDPSSKDVSDARILQSFPFTFI